MRFLENTHNALMVSAFLLAGYAAIQVAFGVAFIPEPYRNVVIEEVRQARGGVYVTATFEKTDCQYQGLFAVAIIGDRAKNLKWRDAQGTPDGVDRPDGLQTLEIFIDFEEESPSFVEIRTVHICSDPSGDPVRKSRIFATIPLEVQ